MCGQLTRFFVCAYLCVVLHRHDLHCSILQSTRSQAVSIERGLEQSQLKFSACMSISLCAGRCRAGGSAVPVLARGDAAEPARVRRGASGLGAARGGVGGRSRAAAADAARGCVAWWHGVCRERGWSRADSGGYAGRRLHSDVASGPGVIWPTRCRKGCIRAARSSAEMLS